jgi:Aerotolerance regulator N-terminal
MALYQNYLSLILMGFLYPEFLFAWLLMIVPVIIHLFNFRKFKKVYFTNVQFLKDIEIQTLSTQKLKERLILAARMLAIFFLVLAFAQPFIKSNEQEASFQKSIVSIYLDNSYSMEAVNKNGSLLDEGKRKIKELVEAYQLNDRFQLLTNDFDGKQQRLLNKDELLEELNNIKVSPITRNYQMVVNRQQEILMNEKQVKRVAYLISDFQKQADWKAQINIDSTIKLHAIPLLANELPNISIDSVYFLSPIHQPEGKEKLVFVVSNHSNEKAENIPYKLTTNSVQKSLGSLSIKPNSSSLDTLEFSGLQAGWQSAEISLKDFPITFDDQLKFTFEVKQKLPVLAVYQNSPVKNIAYAYQTDVFFDFQEVNESQINYSALAKQQLIVLENLKSVSSGLVQQLKQYVANGGNLSVFIPLDADLKSYQQFLMGLGTDYPVELKKQQLKAGQLNNNHPFFKDIFDQLPKNPDLPAASSFFTASSLVRTTKQVLITGQGNENLLSVYQLQKGKIFLNFLPLETEASNFSRHALFLPILFKMAFLGAHSPSLFQVIGQNAEVAINTLELAETETLKLKNKEVEIIPELRKKVTGTSLYFADQIKKPGFYELFHQNNLLAVLAFNENRKESLMQFYKPNELENMLGISSQNILKSTEAPIQQQIKEVNLGLSLWKLCLILSIIFLIVEILLIRFLKGKNIKPLNINS